MCVCCVLLLCCCVDVACVRRLLVRCGCALVLCYCVVLLCCGIYAWLNYDSVLLYCYVVALSCCGVVLRCVCCVASLCWLLSVVCWYAVGVDARCWFRRVAILP